MGLKIEKNRILNSIRCSESDAELKSIAKWIDLFGQYYNSNIDTTELRVELEKKRNLMPKLSISIKDIATIESLVDLARNNVSDGQISMLLVDGERLLEKVYRSVEPL
jgi:hypothetical protein